MLLCIGLLAGCGSDRMDDLVQQLQDQDVSVRRRAVSTLSTRGAEASPAIPGLRVALADTDREVRRLACHTLARLGPASAACLPSLVQALNDQELSVRLAAALAIQQLDPEEKKHTAVLIEAMKKGEGGTIVAVGRYGEKAAWAVPTLVALLKDRRAGVRRIAAESLRDIGPAASTAQDALRDSAKNDADDRVRYAAQEALDVVNRKPSLR